jgi:hypothetical protein
VTQDQILEVADEDEGGLDSTLVDGTGIYGESMELSCLYFISCNGVPAWRKRFVS